MTLLIDIELLGLVNLHGRTVVAATLTRSGRRSRRRTSSELLLARGGGTTPRHVPRTAVAAARTTVRRILLLLLRFVHAGGGRSCRACLPLHVEVATLKQTIVFNGGQIMDTSGDLGKGKWYSTEEKVRSMYSNDSEQKIALMER